VEAVGIAILVFVILGLFVLAKTIRIISQAETAIVERLGRYSRTLTPGLHVMVPFIERMRSPLDLREQVVSFPPQAVITKDNLGVGIDVVIYFQITDAFAASYEIKNPVAAIEQLSVTTLRNVIGGLQLEETLTSRDMINGQLSTTLDEATGKWGIKVNRVEIKAIEPPVSIRDSMEQAMRADRNKRAAILTAEGERQSAILVAEGAREAAILQAEAGKQSVILAAEADREAQILRADGEAQAIATVVGAIKAAHVDRTVLAYQQMQLLPALAQGDSNKVWLLPVEVVGALERFAQKP
jgi:regulator of protease activity HflC (stomatin/prohibitin superfamily)